MLTRRPAEQTAVPADHPWYPARQRRGHAGLRLLLLVVPALILSSGLRQDDPMAQLLWRRQQTEPLRVSGSTRHVRAATGLPPLTAVTARMSRTTPADAAPQRAAVPAASVRGDGAGRHAAVDGGYRPVAVLPPGGGTGPSTAASAVPPRVGAGTVLTTAMLLVLALATVLLCVRLRRERAGRLRSEQRLLELLATAGHELRTPLTAISGYVSLARMGGLADPEKFDVAMSRMTDETRRMSALIDELVLLARLDLGQSLRREPVNLARLCRDATADAQVSSPHHPIRLTILPGRYTVLGDRDRLYQVVTNLLANVRHHTPHGTRTVLGLGNEDGHRVIEIIDDGPGIPAELRDSAFERFVHGGKLPAPVAHPGTGGGNGLGLSVAAAIVAAHGGDLTLEPSARGAWFRIRLPA